VSLQVWRVFSISPKYGTILDGALRANHCFRITVFKIERTERDLMSYRHAFWITAMALIVFLSCPRESSAQVQEAQSFQELQLLVKPGDKVFVSDAQGVVTEGKITGLSSSKLSLKVKSSVRELSESDVSRIRQYRPDSLKNGALIGTGIGAGFALLGILSCNGDCEGSTGDLVGAGLILTALGTGMGIGIDALVQHKELIYIGRSRVSLNLYTIRPIVTPTRKGVSLRLSF